MRISWVRRAEWAYCILRRDPSLWNNSGRLDADSTDATRGEPTEVDEVEVGRMAVIRAIHAHGRL